MQAILLAFPYDGTSALSRVYWKSRPN